MQDELFSTNTSNGEMTKSNFQKRIIKRSILNPPFFLVFKWSGPFEIRPSKSRDSEWSDFRSPLYLHSFVIGLFCPMTDVIVYRICARDIQQAMITLQGMAEQRFSNVYNYQCFTSVMYAIPSIFDILSVGFLLIE